MSAMGTQTFPDHFYGFLVLCGIYISTYLDGLCTLLIAMVPSDSSLRQLPFLVNFLFTLGVFRKFLAINQ